MKNSIRKSDQSSDSISLLTVIHGLYFGTRVQSIFGAITLLAFIALFPASPLLAEEEPAENASNPLAAVSYTDLRVKTFDLDDSDRQELFIDGATMLNPKLKLKYELHWWETDVTGSDENDYESALLKLIYFPKEGSLKSGRPYRMAVGADWKVDLGDQEKGIGSGSDTISPFFGLAIAFKPGLMVIPLVQQFVEYSGEDVNQTAVRVIALQTLEERRWLKYDLVVPYDWETETWPATFEFQFGKSFSDRVGAYVDLQSGIGSYRPYEYAFGVGVRFNY